MELTNISFELPSILHKNVTPHFKLKEFLYLPSAKGYFIPESEEIIENIIKVAQKGEIIRTILGNEAIRATSGYRPKYYNKAIGGALKSQHIKANALDFIHKKLYSRQVRAKLLPLLRDLEIRMELNNTKHTHYDLAYLASQDPGFYA